MNTKRCDFSGCSPPLSSGYSKGSSSADSKYYKLLTTGQNWIDARKECAQDGAWLAMYWNNQDWEDIRGMYIT